VWRALRNLSISTVDACTLLAMKAAAARTAEDAADIRFLADRLGLRSADAVLQVVLAYFPAERLPVRVRLLMRSCSMTVREILDACVAEPEHFQLYLNGFVDAYRRASPAQRAAIGAEAPEGQGQIEGLLSAVVSALSRETGTSPPAWVTTVGSPEPFFAFPARGFAVRLRLMVESPAPFRVRNVLVPENYLDRA
jgi:hypothetical protein